MVVLLVLLTVMGFVLIEAFVLRRRTGERGTAPAAVRTVLARPSSAHWVHPAHAWAVTRGDREARIGVTDLPARLLGRVERFDAPRVGTHIRQGEPFAFLRRGRRSLPVAAPLSGVVIEVNDALRRDPGLLNDSPHDRGWIARIEPEDAGHEVNNLLQGITAERWQDAQQMELARWFAPLAGPVMADGGLAVPDPSDRLDDDDWRRLVETFYPRPLAVTAGSTHPRME
jgi:glycine cleavage system H protein